jgi:hypothetical protein
MEKLSKKEKDKKWWKNIFLGSLLLAVGVLLGRNRI